jgi:hypothetical protein
VERRLREASALWRWRGHPDVLVRSTTDGMPTSIKHRGRALKENGWTSQAPANARKLRKELPKTLKRLMPGISVRAYEEWDAGFALLDQVAEVDTVDTDGFGDWAKPSSFRDPRHLSHKGARDFTRQLWDTPEFRDAVLDGLASTDVAADPS